MPIIPTERRVFVENGHYITRTVMLNTDTGESRTDQQDGPPAPPGTPEGEADPSQINITGTETPTRVAPVTGTDPSQIGGDATAFGSAFSNGFGNLGSLTPNQNPSAFAGQNYGSPFSGGFTSGQPANQGFGGFGSSNMQGMNQNPLLGGVPQVGGNAFTPGNNPLPGQGGQQSQPTPDDFQRAGNLARFSPDNPGMAVVQAMMDNGMQPFNKFNPFTQMIQRAAEGLAAAFMINNALNPSNNTMQGGQQPDTGAMFHGFLDSALKGGNVFNTLGQAAGRVPDVVSAYRNFQQQGGPGTASQVNPFLNALADMMSSQGFEGTTGMMAALLGPSMPRSLARGYAGGLEQSLANATKGFWGQNAPQGGQLGGDFMKYLLGV